MSNDSQNDVLFVESCETSYSPVSRVEEQVGNDKPLMKLFKQLIDSNIKENTVLTNTQIADLLHKEFDMDIWYTHDLEIEIYLNLTKKFLKEWPQWDDFDHSLHKLKIRNNSTLINQMLENNYKNLKIYLNQMLQVAKPLINEAVKEAKEKDKNSKKQNIDSDVVLEVHCSRSQLNKLFFRRPHPDHDDTIFNLDYVPSKIVLQNITLNSLLNWPDILISVNLGVVNINRVMKLIHHKHTLINKKLLQPEHEPFILNNQMQMKVTKSQQTLSDLYNALTSSFISSSTVYMIFLCDTIINLIKEDLSVVDINTPASSAFRRNLNKYPFVRHLYSEVNITGDSSYNSDSANSFDLQLQEISYPCLHLNIAKLDSPSLPQIVGSDNCQWLKVFCQACEINIDIQNLEWSLKRHIEEYHQEETDWQCMNCKQTISNVALADNGWKHYCSEEVIDLNND